MTELITGLIIVARPAHKLLWREEFTFNQLAAALDLLLQCVLQRGYRDEMWAYVYQGEKHIGYLVLRKAFLYGDWRNKTSDVSI